MTNNQINDNLIEIIQLSLTIFRWFKFTLKPPNRITSGKL